MSRTRNSIQVYNLHLNEKPFFFKKNRNNTCISQNVRSASQGIVAHWLEFNIFTFDGPPNQIGIKVIVTIIRVLAYRRNIPQLSQNCPGVGSECVAIAKFDGRAVTCVPKIFDKLHN